MAVTSSTVRFDSFPVGWCEHESACGVALRLQLRDAFTERGQHRRGVRLSLDAAGAVDICEHLRLDSDLEPVAQHNAAKTRC